MSKLVACPECNKSLQVPDDLLGKKVQCPECAHRFTATAEDNAENLNTGTTSSPPVPTKKPASEDRASTDSGRKKRRYEEDDLTENDDDRPRRSRRGRRSMGIDYVPHRAGMILAFGIVGLVAFFVFPFATYIFGPMAWFMGNGDLREMSEGRMDPEGESTTQTGRILGMIATIIGLVSLVIFCVFMIFYLFCFALIFGAAAANANKNFPPQGRKGF